MSIDSAGKLFDWIQGAKLSKALFAIIFLVYGFLLFEQYTDHYRLARLDQTSTVLKSLETGALKDQVQADFNQQTYILFSPKQVSPWPIRAACGGVIFIVLCLLSIISKDGIANCIPLIFLGLAVGGGIALIPDFCPTWKECIVAGLIPLVFLVFCFFDAINEPDEELRKCLRNHD